MCSCFTCYYTCHRAWMISTSLGPIFGPLHTRHRVVHQDRDHFGTAHTSVAVQITCCCVGLGLISLKNFAGIRRVFIYWNYRKPVLISGSKQEYSSPVIYHFWACLGLPLRAIAANDVMYQHPVTSNWYIASYMLVY